MCPLGWLGPIPGLAVWMGEENVSSYLGYMMRPQVSSFGEAELRGRVPRRRGMFTSYL